MARMSFPDKVAEFDRLKQERDALDKKIKDLQNDLIGVLDKNGEKSATVEVEGRRFKITKVQSSSMVIDEASLKRVLGEKGWMKVSTRILDRRKLESAIATDEIDPVLVAECSEEKLGAPYVRLTS